MYMRMLRLEIAAGARNGIRDLYEERVIARVRGTEGCRLILLLQDEERPTHIVSVTLWDDATAAARYEAGPLFADIMDEVRRRNIPGDGETRVRLSDAQRLEVETLPQEPSITGYRVYARRDFSPDDRGHDPRIRTTQYTRLVTQKIAAGQGENFRAIYTDEVLPVLGNTPGCLAVYLLENLDEPREFVSLTVWENRDRAEDYERSGLFLELVNRVSPTYPQLMRWKLTLESQGVRRARTSEDMETEHCRIVTGWLADG